MGIKSRIFIDFWNFQLNWQDRSAQSCDWTRVPTVLLGQAGELFATVGSADPLELDETLVHASVKNDPSEAKLKGWLTTFLDKQPSFRVKIRERRTRRRGIRCNACKSEHTVCPDCQTEYVSAPEKGVDAAIVTDLLTFAWERQFELAILVSSDADLIPAVERVQERGLKVINATWSGHGYELAHTCWGSFHLDTVIPLLERPRS